MINVIRFTASWCSPCRSLAPIMDEIKMEMSSNTNVRFNVIDVDADRMTASQYNVRSVPTVIIENNGVVVQQLIGVKSKNEYQSAIKNATFNK
jgi:thioredoxin 1